MAGTEKAKESGMRNIRGRKKCKHKFPGGRSEFDGYRTFKRASDRSEVSGDKSGRK